MNPRTPSCDLFGIEVPSFLAGMGGVAYAEVCAAVSEAGGFGTLGVATASPAGIREQMREVRGRTGKPLGVDLLAALPEQMIGAMGVIIAERASASIAGLDLTRPTRERSGQPAFRSCPRRRA
jgi:enoyl-[acyl-carrier protein] reductase II